MSQSMETLKNEVRTNEDKATDRSVRMEDRLVVMLEKEMEKMEVNGNKK